MSWIFQQSDDSRRALSQQWTTQEKLRFDTSCQRKDSVMIPTLSELQTVRYFTQLSQKNFSIDTHFYPLGSCTMKYNPRIALRCAHDPAITNLHPYQQFDTQQGLLSMMAELSDMLSEITGMQHVSLAPCAGAQGEFAGVAMIRAYHQANGDSQRDEIIVPDAAHGTNPATARMAGCKVKEIPTDLKTGDLDLVALEKALGPKTAGIMLTNPSTMGVFEHQIETVAKMVHQAGGLLYYDGANLNAIMDKAKPGVMGFDVMHMNVHKTFATPHGGGGPGAGPIAVNDRLEPFLPVPRIEQTDDQQYQLVGQSAYPNSIGPLHAFAGNIGVLVRTYVYLKMLGGNGLKRVSEMATLNANYLMVQLKQAGFDVTLPQRRASHEFLISFAHEKKAYGVSANDVAKALLDYGIHAPTVYFPLLVPECFLIEPTETESVQQLDAFIEALIEIKQKAKTDPEYLKNAPYHQPVGRLDDVKAARELNVAFGQCC